MKRTRKVAILILLAAAPLVLAACNTVQGFGKDLTYAGEKTEEWISGKKAGESK
ncbi:hypothetical protein PHYC_03878 [Phycisphaerales bacterium]|nr:hypothetical protein PHYC_03878 [Phycisphaerales bacterium]